MLKSLALGDHSQMGGLSLQLLFAALVLVFSVNVFATANSVYIGLIYSKSQCNLLQRGHETADNSRAEEGEDKLKNYTTVIHHFGHTRIALCPGMSEAELAKTIASLRALIVPGGDDVAPKYYGEALHEKTEIVDEDFDEFEFKVFQRAQKQKLKTLGICRGLQLINVARGGSLYQDIPAQLITKSKVVHRIKQEEKSEPAFHPLHVLPLSTLAKIWGTTSSVTVNTYHHQGIKKLGNGLKVVATTNDGLIEVIESKGEPYVLAVQFHPEKEFATNPQMEKLLAYFFKKLQ